MMKTTARKETETKPKAKPETGRRDKKRKEALADTFDAVTVGDYLTLCFLVIRKKHPWLFALTLVIGIAGVIAGAYIKKQKFESTAQLLFKSGAAEISIAHSSVRRDMVQVHTEEIITTQSEFLSNNAIIDELVDEIGLDFFVVPEQELPRWKQILKTIADKVNIAKDAVERGLKKAALIPSLSPRQEMIGKIHKNLEAEPLRKTQIVELAFKSKYPEKSALLLEKLIAIYLKRYGDLYADFDGYSVYLEETEKASERLAVAQRKLADFNKEYRIADFEVEKASLTSKTITLASGITDVNAERLDTFIAIEPEYERLSMEVRMLTDAFEIYNKAAQDRQLSKQSRADFSIHVLDPPNIPCTPVVGRLKIIGIGIPSVIIMAFGIVLGVEWISRCRVVD